MRALFRVGCLIFLVTLWPIWCEAQSKDTDLNRLRISIAMKSVLFADLAAILQVQYGVFIGFEHSPLNLNEPEYSFYTTPLDKVQLLSARNDTCNRNTGCFSIFAKNAPLKEVLDSIVAQMSGYKWEIRNGVVNIFPKSERDSRIEGLLSVKIAKLHIAKGTTLFEVRKAVLTTPEVRTYLEENGLDKKIDIRSVRLSMMNVAVTLPKDFDAENLTLNELLNELALVKSSGWSIYTIRDGNDNLELSL